MILLKRGEISIIPVTVTEKSGGGILYYRFNFTHDVTKVEYSVLLKLNASLEDRIDFFDIDVDEVFGSADDGFFSYEIFTHGLDPEQTYPDTFLVETGKMRLLGASTSPVQYEGSPKEYITYGR